MAGKPRPESYFKDKYIGKKWYRWTIIRLGKKTKNKQSHVFCQCECGNIKEIDLSSILIGASKSCGCLLSEVLLNRNLKHGLAGSAENRAWNYAKARCAAKKGKNYRRYVARGIKVCERWLISFDNFLEDMGKKPSAKHSLDRIDNDKGYYKENCRWALIAVQSSNRSDNIYIEYKNKKLTMSQWARKYKMPIKTLSSRYAKGIRGDKLFFKGNLRWSNEKFDN